jgi:lipoprotein-releasing system permease protein
MKLPFELYLAFRYLRFHRGKTFISLITLISIAGVTVGCAALVIALALNNGFAEDIRQRILSGSAHLQVLHAEDALASGMDEVQKRVEGIPGVTTVSPVLHSPAMMIPDNGQPAYAEIWGVDPVGQAGAIAAGPATVLALATLGETVEGGLNRIVLGENLAANLGVRVGDRVRVMVPRVTLSPFTPIPRSRVFELAATFRSDHFDQDSTRAYVALEDTRSLMAAKEATTWLEVRLDDLDELEHFKEAFRAELSYPWVVADLFEQNQELIRALRTEKLILFLAIGLIVVVAALNIVSTLVLMVSDKIRDIGALSSMGVQPARVARIFLYQGLVIGFTGTVLGLSLGVALSWWLGTYRMIPLDPDVYWMDHVPFVLNGMDILTIGAAAMLVSLTATLYPAWNAGRLDPVEALRYE